MRKLKPDKKWSAKNQRDWELLSKGIEIGIGMADLELKKCWRCNKKFKKINKYEWQPQQCKHYPRRVRLLNG